MVGDFLHFAGWEEIEFVELSDGTMEEGQRPATGMQGGLQALMGMMGIDRRDPLWVRILLISWIKVFSEVMLMTGWE
jgi:hypothetical protein